MPIIATRIFYLKIKSIYRVEPIRIKVNHIELSRNKINWVVVESNQLSQTDPRALNIKKKFWQVFSRERLYQMLIWTCSVLKAKIENILIARLYIDDLIFTSSNPSLFKKFKRVMTKRLRDYWYGTYRVLS